MTETVLTWLKQQSGLEVTGVITGLLCVYLAAKNNIWNWPVAIVSVGIYIFIFYEVKLYADMGLQFYFLAMNIYGWYYWSNKPADKQKTPVKRLSQKEAWISAAVVVVFTVLLGTGLHYTPASYPYLDSFCAACSLVAQALLARKILENWLIWVFVDIIYVGIYIFKDLHLTAAMYAAYVVIAAVGYIDWKKDWEKQGI